MFRELSNEQSRQSVDSEQVFSAYQKNERELRDKFNARMNWRKIDGVDYLYRVWGSDRTGRPAKSLGRRSVETEELLARFNEGKERALEVKSRLGVRLNEMAPVNRALQLNRVPTVIARILREADASGFLGRSVFVVGTNAMFAYERLCGVQVESGLLATGDVDLLFDARVKLKLLSPEIAQNGLLGILKKVDRSFNQMAKGGFRAVNADGFMVDLIAPMPKNRFSTRNQTTVSDAPDDLNAVEIEGLGWLVNAPKIYQTVIDERGYPVPIACPDPRAFALHKIWLSNREDREPIKRQRDEAQALLVCSLIKERLPHLSFDDEEALSALPKHVRDYKAELLEKSEKGASVGSTPNW